MKRVLHALLLGLMTLAALPSASAKDITLDFENLPPGPLFHGDAWNIGNDIYFETFSNSTVAQNGDYVGEVVDSNWAFEQCGQLQCTSNGSTYVAAVNDAAMYFSTFSGNAFSVRSLSASFLGPYADSYTSIVGAVRLMGVHADGSSVLQTFTFGAPGADGYAFQSLSVSNAFAADQFTELYVFGLACNSAGNCAGFNSDRAQFALDDLVLISAVPEPATWLMFGSGMLLVATRRRRA
ncbi:MULTISPECIES: NF038120 family PEP-CTERM protein [unclassified Duganella]|uniref:NF038120 family PEP-CTERM protein n=1 Tax=unclassified Duganella TaxID=2636909 RepID=UPI00087E138B|nr:MULTISPECIES: NF038120 family PEP-CTERM protein [unclassified Duganella]SDH36841.1 PEP-CTERM protein-sorting domain-containing protein [Duganella sp. OV458]SDK53196.1 PEP-CTERM protein-sorting domain-containing protein [Duganella sp. OV510]